MVEEDCGEKVDKKAEIEAYVKQSGCLMVLPEQVVVGAAVLVESSTAVEGFGGVMEGELGVSWSCVDCHGCVKFGGSKDCCDDGSNLC